MSSLDRIKARIERLYATHPDIHMSIRTSHPKLDVKEAPAVITGVYPNLFRVVENDSGQARSHIVRYAEVLTGQVEISELA